MQGLPRHWRKTFKNACMQLFCKFCFPCNSWPTANAIFQTSQIPHKNNNNDVDLPFGYQISAPKRSVFWWVFWGHKFHTPEDSGKQLGGRFSLSKRLLKKKNAITWNLLGRIFQGKVHPPNNIKGIQRVKNPGQISEIKT